MNDIKYISKQFCHELLKLDINRSKALVNLVMALSSYQFADSLVQLSLSPIYHYQFSSVFKAIEHLAHDAESYRKVVKKILRYCLKYLKQYLQSSKRILLQTDVTPLIKAHSPTLADRQYVKCSNNVIKGNKPINIGYPLSSINISLDGKWSLPLLRGRVPLDHTESSYAVAQLKSLLPELRQSTCCDLIVNTTDSSYTHAAYLSSLYVEKDLICISRFRAGSKVFVPAKGDNPQGAKQIYGACFYLNNETRLYMGKKPKTGAAYTKEQTSIYELPCTVQQSLQAETTKGRQLHIDLYRWNNLKIRSKNGHCMKHKPFDLVSVKVRDAQTQHLVFKRPLFFCISGQMKDQISLEQAYQDYRQRYDIEPSFRFNKQKLFLDRYQGEEVQHIDNFLLINQLANHLLFWCKEDVQFIPHKWEKKRAKAEVQTAPLSIAKTYRSTEALFLTFDETPFLPKTSKKGKGNIKKSRTHYEVVKKPKKKYLIDI